jgi:hypothetical protein
MNRLELLRRLEQEYVVASSKDPGLGAPGAAAAGTSAAAAPAAAPTTVAAAGSSDAPARPISGGFGVATLANVTAGRSKRFAIKIQSLKAAIEADELNIHNILQRRVELKDVSLEGAARVQMEARRRACKTAARGGVVHAVDA